jgi:hypothetical protein
MLRKVGERAGSRAACFFENDDLVGACQDARRCAKGIHGPTPSKPMEGSRLRTRVEL